MLRGPATVSYWADDVRAARDWYAEILGIEAYFQRPDADQPAYVEFRVGPLQFELGIVDRRYAPPGTASGVGGTVLYWHVSDLNAAFEKLISLGAQQYEPPTQRGEDFATASVIDPFGNILGVMYNPHFRKLHEPETPNKQR